MAKRGFSAGGAGAGGLNPHEVLKQAQKMQKDIKKAKDALKNRIVKASSGGEAVTAYVNCAREVVKIEMDKEVIDPDDVEMLEDLLITAINQALKKAEKIIEKEMNKYTGGINIPGLL